MKKIIIQYLIFDMFDIYWILYLRPFHELNCEIKFISDLLLNLENIKLKVKGWFEIDF